MCTRSGIVCIVFYGIILFISVNSINVSYTDLTGSIFICGWDRSNTFTLLFVISSQSRMFREIRCGHPCDNAIILASVIWLQYLRLIVESFAHPFDNACILASVILLQ